MQIRRIIRESSVGKKIWPYFRKIKSRCITKKYKKEIRLLINDAEKTEKHIFYCGVCESSNMGDMAQTFCTLNWMRNNYPDYRIILCRISVFRDIKCNLIGTMKKVAKPDDIIFFQSGYNTHDLGDIGMSKKRCAICLA